MEKTRPDGFCLLCSKADLDTNDFGCDEPIGLCGTNVHVSSIFNTYNIDVFSHFLWHEKGEKAF